MDEYSTLRLVFVLVLLGILSGCRPIPTPSSTPIDRQAVLEEALGRLELPKVAQEENGFALLSSVLGSEASAKEVEAFTALAPIYSAYKKGGASEALDEIYEANEDGRIEGFEFTLVRLQVALAKPVFEWPQARTPNLGALQKTVESCLVLGLHFELDGDPSKASDCYLTALELAAQYSGKGMPFVQGVSLKLQGLALTSYLRLLEKKELPVRLLAQAKLRLKALRTTEADLRLVCDNQFAVNVMEAKSRPKEELREYVDAYMTVRPYLGSLLQPSRAGVDVKSVFEASDRRGLTTPDYEEQIRRFRFLMTRLEAARLVVDLKLYGAEHGAYPEKLKQLVPKFSEAIPRDYLNPDGVFQYQRDRQRFFLRTQSPDLDKLDVTTPFYTHFPPGAPPSR